MTALMMFHINTLLPPMLDCVYASYVMFADAPLVKNSGDGATKSMWPALFSNVTTLADRRHAADLFLHVILAQLIRGNAPSPGPTQMDSTSNHQVFHALISSFLFCFGFIQPPCWTVLVFQPQPVVAALRWR